MQELEKFYTMVEKELGKASQRMIGHICSSAAITLNVRPEGFIEDWGAFELDTPKFAKATSSIWVRFDLSHWGSIG